MNFNSARMTPGVSTKSLFGLSNDIWLSVAVSVFFLYYSLVLSLPGSSLLQDPDTFWHIKTGQWILDHAQFPTVDFFSYTAAGKPWIATEWLSQIFFAAAYNLGGWRAVVILTALADAGVMALLCLYLLKNLRFSIAIGWVALTEFLISPHLLARPHIFSFVLLVIWMIKLLDTYDHSEFNFRSLLAFVPLMVLWANLHGSFTFGLAMIYIFAGYRLCENAIQSRYAVCWRILVIMSAVTISACLTPYGIKPALMTKEVLDLKYTISQIDELHPPDFQRFPILLVFLVGIFSGMAGFGVRLRGPRLIAFAVIVAVGLSYTRGLVMFFLLAPLILAQPMSKSVSYLATEFSSAQILSGAANADPVLRFLSKRLRAIPAACLAFGIVVTTTAWWRADFAPAKSSAPQAALDYVRRANITGNVFNSYNFGGFLIFSGIPTFVDGRALPFGDDFLRKYFDASGLVDIRKTFELLDEYKVKWALLTPTAPLARALARDAHWDEVFSDKYSVVFARHS
jgi:hypothetical protein